MDKIENSRIKDVYVGVVVLIIIPIIIYLLSTIPLFPAGANNDWAGFWGGYIGALIGAWITLTSVRITIKSEESVRRKNHVEAIRPMLSGKIEILTYSDIVNLKDGRGAILHIAGGLAYNGCMNDRSSFKDYLNEDDKTLKAMIVRYRLVNLSDYSVNKICVKVNDYKGFNFFSLLPKDEAVVFFIVSLENTEKEKYTELQLTFEFEDEIGNKKYRQTDKMKFYKDEKGTISNACGIMAMTHPEEISNK